jgi:Flp pilus assembly protein TadG
MDRTEVRRLRTYFRRDEEAQGVIEFAIIATALLLMFLGTVDFSRFMYYNTAISSAARVGASLGTNACLTPDLCGRSYVPSDDYIMQAASCEAKPFVTLQPQIDCNTCIKAACTAPSAVTACAGEDICVQRTPAGAAARGQTVVVTVGYHFNFVSPIIGQFFPNKLCFTGDTLAHNLCSHSTGIVF